MYNFKILLFIIAVSFAGCKSQKIAPKPDTVKQEAIEKSEPTPKTVQPVGKISSKEERFTAAQGETMSWGSNRFFVIVGSFSVLDNAKRFKDTLINENFNPGILINENGLFRVCVNTYSEETMARNRITEIRIRYPKYSDIWLLIKKQ